MRARRYGRCIAVTIFDGKFLLMFKTAIPFMLIVIIGDLIRMYSQ